LPDYNELLNTMKKAATEAVEASKPVNVCFGKVTNDSPLQILVDQKMTLGASQLVLSRNVTEFTTMVTVQWATEKETQTHTHKVEGSDGEGDSINITSKTQSVKHTHDIEGTKQMTFHNQLEKGEEVILLRMQGGQKYIVLDRIGGG